MYCLLKPEVIWLWPVNCFLLSFPWYAEEYKRSWAVFAIQSSDYAQRPVCIWLRLFQEEHSSMILWQSAWQVRNSILSPKAPNSGFGSIWPGFRLIWLTIAVCFGWRKAEDTCGVVWAYLWFILVSNFMEYFSAFRSVPHFHFDSSFNAALKLYTLLVTAKGGITVAVAQRRPHISDTVVELYSFRMLRKLELKSKITFFD